MGKKNGGGGHRVCLGDTAQNINKMGVFFLPIF